MVSATDSQLHQSEDHDRHPREDHQVRELAIHAEERLQRESQGFRRGVVDDVNETPNSQNGDSQGEEGPRPPKSSPQVDCYLLSQPTSPPFRPGQRV